MQTAGITAPIVEIQLRWVADALPTDDAEQAAEDAALLAAWSVVNPDGLLDAPTRAADDQALGRLEEAVLERWERGQPLVHAQSCFYEVLLAAALTLGCAPDASRVADADETVREVGGWQGRAAG